MGTDRPPDSMLDLGLRAAFGSAFSAREAGEPERLASLGETHGATSRILLREAPDEMTPFVRPCDDATANGLPDNSRYQILGEIARGGVGVILKSRDVNLGRDIAIKVLRKEHARNAAMVRRFVEEAQISGQLQHPGILPVYELGLRSPQAPYFTMKLVKGQTLAALLHHRSSPGADRQRFLNIFQHVCQTVAFAHAKGVIHRDLKPSNVLVGAFGEVQVVDWGLAKVLTQGGLADESHAESAHEPTIETVRTGADHSASMAGSVMGTPAYMSPEQARGEVDALDERTDVFSLGAILCEILTGAPPYAGDKSEVLRKAAAGELDDALARLERCDADHELILLARKCLAPAVAGRPDNAGTLAHEITTFLESLEARARDLEVQAARAAATANVERRTRRLIVALAGMAVVALAAGGSGYFLLQQQRRDRIRDRTETVNASLNRTAMLLGRAKESPVGQFGSWDEALASGQQLDALLNSGDAEQATVSRARTLLDDLHRAAADRRIIERLEDVVIAGATHADRESWKWMQEELRRAFADYGIELAARPKPGTAAKIRASALAPQLVDGVELWIATCFDVQMKGGTNYAMQDLLAWVDVLYEADADPFRTRLRKLLWGGKPRLEDVRALGDSADLQSIMPRTLSWLAVTYGMAGDPEGAVAIYRRALLVHPNDFMLNFDFAYLLTPLGRWPEAITYYRCALAIRPNVGGVWRCLGIALHKTGDTPGAIDALRQSIRVQPDHAATHVDLGRALEEGSDIDGAIDAYKSAIALRPELPSAYGRLGHALQKKGDLTKALEAYRKCHALGQGDPAWKEPSGDWIRECEDTIRKAKGE